MSFNELTQRISPKLKAITHKLDGRYTAFNDEDLYQEALIHLWHKFHEGTILDKTDSYILQGCFFFLKNYIRKTHKRIDARLVSIHETREGAVPIEETLVYENTKDADILNNSLVLRAALRVLDTREKKIFDLYLKGLTTREIGKFNHISHVMVVKILRRIKGKLEPLRLELIQ